MMNSYSLENIKIDNGIFNVFQKTVVDNKEKIIYTTTVQDGEEMRLDRVCDRIYGTTYYVEELMVLNNMMNPWTIKVGDEIVYFGLNEEEKMREYDENLDKLSTKDSLVNPNKKTRKDPNRSDNLTPTIKPKGMKSFDVNKENNKIKIINKLG